MFFVQILPKFQIAFENLGPFPVLTRRSPCYRTGPQRRVNG
jgi:hypothetical protein